MIKFNPYPILFSFVLLMTGCTGMKHVSTSDPLYVGTKITYESSHKGSRNYASVIDELLKPEPNKKVLWMRPAVARNNMLSDTAKTRKFWKNKVAEPVLLSGINPVQISNGISNRLFHQGYFQNRVTFDTLHIGQRKIKYNYLVSLQEPYKLDTVIFPAVLDDLTRSINKTRDKSLLAQGEIYTLDAVKKERLRIDNELKETGYIYFSPDFILVKADTTSGGHSISTAVSLKREIPPESRKPYTIGKVVIYEGNLSDASTSDTIQSGQFYLISGTKSLNIKTLQQGLFLKPGELYKRTNYNHTIRYFNELPIVRNASVKFLTADTTDQVDVLVYLTQRKRFSYSAEFNTVFQSTNYFGPGMIFSYTDKNANKDAEVLKLNLHASFQVQIVEGQVNPAYEMGLSIAYTLPQFFPGYLFKSVNKSLPKTTITAAYNFFNRLDLYRMNSVVTGLEYSWSKSDRMHHFFRPLEISFTQLPEDSKSQDFIDYLEENPGVQQSFDEQFILGMGYEFTYQPVGRGNNSFYFRGGVDVAGNFLDLVYSATNAVKDTNGRYQLFGVPFSQYIRPKIDIRKGISIRQKSTLITRFSAGVGIPIGNSSILPYIKQFYVGGTNSLRSFVARSVGPGSEFPPTGYNDLTGDIRLEGNLEYRFELAGNLKGALFLDAGNIWLFREDPTRPEGNFRFDSFLQQMAISSGWGLRWDFDFIVVRLDFAYTLRTPYLPEGQQWSNGIQFWRPAINFAIGYPF